MVHADTICAASLKSVLLLILLWVNSPLSLHVVWFLSRVRKKAILM